MARKHEKFSYSFGWRTAPEQWHFGWNEKSIQLDNSIRSQLAMLMIQGEETKAEDILKRILRKQEKEESYVCIGFYSENGKEYYFTQDLKCRSDDLQDKLLAYKEWKRYIKERNCDLTTHTVTSGCLMQDGKMSEGKEEAVYNRIDLSKPCTIKLVKPMRERVFQF